LRYENVQEIEGTQEPSYNRRPNWNVCNVYAYSYATD